MHNIIALAVFFIWKASSLILYIWTIYASYMYILKPLIDIYGLWTLLGITFGLGFLSFASSVSFFWMPRKPQATPRPFTSGDIS
jgi:hypothetical protein